MTDGDIRASLIQLAKVSSVQAKAMMAQANRELVPRPKQQVTIVASRLRELTRMNPPIFYRSKVDKYPQEFRDEVTKILLVMGLSTSEKAELATYQLKDVSQEWYVKWRDNRPLRGCSLTWEIFKMAFLDRFFPREMRE